MHSSTLHFRLVFLLMSLVTFNAALGGQSNPIGLHWDWHDMKTDDGWPNIAQSTELSAEERTGLIRALSPRNQSSTQMAQEFQDLASGTVVKRVRLDADDGTEFLAEATDRYSCSPTGNCAFWVVRKTGDRYTVILYRGAIQSFTIQPTVTNGFRDLILVQHGSATDLGLTLYRFNGSRYQQAGCYNAAWAILQNGQVHDLDEPQITPCPMK